MVVRLLSTPDIILQFFKFAESNFNIARLTPILPILFRIISFPCSCSIRYEEVVAKRIALCLNTGLGFHRKVILLDNMAASIRFERMDDMSRIIAGMTARCIKPLCQLATSCLFNELVALLTLRGLFCFHLHWFKSVLTLKIGKMSLKEVDRTA